MMADGADIEAAAGELAGRRLDGVRYYTLPYGSRDKPADYGIDLVTMEGTTGVTWSRHGEFGYGLQLRSGPLVGEVGRAEVCSVADRPPWTRVLGECITEARVHWLEMTWGSQQAASPVALALRFAGGTGIAVVCGSWRGPREAVFATGDDIVVAWQPGALAVLAPYLPGNLLGP